MRIVLEPALLLGLLGKLYRFQNHVLMLDTFRGSSEVCGFDNTSGPKRNSFPRPVKSILIRRQAATLGIGDQIEIHSGLFSETFEESRNAPESQHLYFATSMPTCILEPRMHVNFLPHECRRVGLLYSMTTMASVIWGLAVPLINSSLEKGPNCIHWQELPCSIFRTPRVSCRTGRAPQLCESGTEGFEG